MVKFTNQVIGLWFITFSWVAVAEQGQVSSDFEPTETTSSYQVIKQSLVQGGFLIGKTSPGTVVKFLKHNVQVSDEGHFVIGFGRDFPKQASLNLVNSDGQQQIIAIDIKPRQWKVERIDGIPPSKVTPTKPEILKRIRQEGRQIRKARAAYSPWLAFKEPFIRPAEGRISGVYGSQRVLNGVPKRPHFGLDIAAIVGTPVVAPAAGKVTLVHRDMFYSGGTIIIDHGQGVTSTFLHLSATDIELGAEVAAGQVIGKIGATGRASGPHLDWRINWFEQRLDPALFINL